MDQQAGRQRLGTLLSMLIFYLIARSIAGICDAVLLLYFEGQTYVHPIVSGMAIVIPASLSLLAGIGLWFRRRWAAVRLAVIALWSGPALFLVFYALFLAATSKQAVWQPLPFGYRPALPDNFPAAVFVAGILTTGLLNSERVKAIYH